MGIADMLRKFSENRKAKSEKFKELEEDMIMRKKLEERQKSANKRELERYMKEQEEAQIKQALDKIHKKKNQELWKSNTILKKSNSMLKTDRPILMEENIFLDNKTKIPISGERMFFKW